METAVQWLVEQLEPNIMWTDKAKNLVDQAKEMEKQQIIALAAELYEDMFGIDGKEYAIDYYNKLKEL